MSSSQAFILFAGYQFEKYEKLDFTFVGESTCSDSWVRTFLTGKPSLALPCYADKKFAGVGENDLRITFTPRRSGAGAGGRRGPVQERPALSHRLFSLTSDILDGLPKHYTEF